MRAAALALTLASVFGSDLATLLVALAAALLVVLVAALLAALVVALAATFLVTALAVVLALATFLAAGALLATLLAALLAVFLAAGLDATGFFYAKAWTHGKPLGRTGYAAAMAARTVVNSVELAAGPPVNVADLEAALQALRLRFPGAVLERYLERVPRVAANVRIAAGAAVIGDVRLGEDVSIWYGCVLRGDVNHIEIRERSNVQDGAVVHLGDRNATLVAEEVVIGHRAVVHGCTIGGGTLVGIQATILDDAVIGEGSVIGSCALVTAGAVIPPHSLVVGVPGRVIKTLTAEDEDFHRRLAGKYVRLAHNYRVG